MKIDIDWRFVDIPYEVMLLGQYLSLLEDNLERIERAEVDRIRDAHPDWDDEAERAVASHLEAQIRDGVTTRFLAASALTATWALFEASTVRFANHARRERGLSLALSDLRGDFLARAEKYFTEVVHLPGMISPPRLVHLRRVALLRHAIVHANGRVADIRSGDRKALEAAAREDPRLQVVDGYLIIPLEVARESWQLVKEALGEIQERIGKVFPVAGTDGAA